MRQVKAPGNILAIECAVGRGSVSILNGVSVIASAGDSQSVSRAEELITIINSLMEKAGMERHDLNMIAVSTGPGSYSGIRIGVATALGLKNSLNIPCVGVSALDAMAIFATPSLPLTCAVPVGKKDVAWRQYKSGNEWPEPLGPPEMGTETDFLMTLGKDADLPIFLHSELLGRLDEHHIPGIQLLDAGLNLSEMIGRAAAIGQGEPVLRPIYLRNRAHATQKTGF